ncbi:MAG: hypothetical protein CMF62_02455 [Magnetococcales bacterium]|nr:hypothetical protein [Magnetococcales bacterium]|tara:strand:- start:17876 stop:19015 length:1140 start_codon:yes stop_codon:yes gene_type:complete
MEKKQFEIFKNPICKFRILNNHHLIKSDEKINVFCSVFFKLKKHYKNFSEYVNGLSKLIDLIEKTNSKYNYKYILFIDHHIMNDTEIMKFVYASKKTIPILFTCSDYMKDNYHLDLFGTIVRYIPFFNFENNFTNRVIAIDIELPKESLKILNFIKNIEHNNIIFISFEFWNFFRKNNLHLAGGFISSSIKYNKNILLDFIKSADTIKSVGLYNKRLTTWGFGIDEIFLNEVFKNKIEYSLIKDYQITQVIYKSKKYLFDKSRIKNSYIIFKKIIDKVREVDSNIISDKPTLKDMVNLIDKYTYKIQKRNKISDIISINFYKAINNALKNNTEFLERDKMIFIYKYLNNIISCKFLVTIDKGNIKVIDIYDVIYDSTYN